MSACVARFGGAGRARYPPVRSVSPVGAIKRLAPPASPCSQTGLARSCAQRQPSRATAAVGAGVPGRFYGAHIVRPAPRVSDGPAACLFFCFPVLRFALSRLLSLRPGSRTFAIQKHVHAPVACETTDLGNNYDLAGMITNVIRLDGTRMVKPMGSQ